MGPIKQLFCSDCSIGTSILSIAWQGALQPGERLGESGLIGVESRGFAERVARLAIAPEAHERPSHTRIVRPRLGDRWRAPVGYSASDFSSCPVCVAVFRPVAGEPRRSPARTARRSRDARPPPGTVRSPPAARRGCSGPGEKPGDRRTVSSNCSKAPPVSPVSDSAVPSLCRSDGLSGASSTPLRKCVAAALKSPLSSARTPRASSATAPCSSPRNSTINGSGGPTSTPPC